jgi:hypothetical protein
MTMDGGTTWVDVTAQVKTSRMRIIIPQQTVTNPVCGFKLAVSGDAIEIDCCMAVRGLPAGFSWAPSPVLTTTASVARQVDLLTATISGIGFSNLSAISGAVELMLEPGSPGFLFLTADEGANNNFTLRCLASGNWRPETVLTDPGGGAGSASAVTASAEVQVPFGQVFAMSGAGGGGVKSVAFNGHPRITTHSPHPWNASTMTTVRLGGGSASGSNNMSGWLRSVTLWPFVLSAAQLQAASRPLSLTGVNPAW